MKLLFVVGDLSKKNDANINIIKLLCNELLNDGYECFILGKGIMYEYKQDYETKNTRYIVISDLENYTDIVIAYLPKYMSRMLLWIKGKYPKLYSYLNARIAQKKYINKYTEKIEDVCNLYSIDVAISVSAPITSSISLAKSKINSRKVMYQLDPYYAHYLNNNFRRKFRALINELKIYKNIDCSIITDLIYSDNRTNLLKQYIGKMHALPFPNIRKIEHAKTVNDILFDTRKINCVFVGNIYNDIRNPKYLIKIFEKINNDNILIHFVGGGDSEKLKDSTINSQAKMIFHGIVDNNTAINSMLSADILINIGNKISNQMPSKIFDYISTGKPIINIVKMDNCPTLEYTQRYPLCLNIFEDRDLIDMDKIYIERFCNENKGKRIEYSKIEKLYHDCTVKIVGEEFLDVINKIL